MNHFDLLKPLCEINPCPTHVPFPNEGTSEMVEGYLLDTNCIIHSYQHKCPLQAGICTQ